MFASVVTPLVRQLIYPRAQTHVAASATTYSLDVGAATLRGWVVNPGRDRALVYFGGNGERLDPWREVLDEWLPDHTSYLLAYRGYGASDGLPTQRALSADALALVDHVSQRHPDVLVDAMGRSLGTAVAVHVATNRPLGHLVLVTPFDSLAATAGDLIGGLPLTGLIADQWDSAAVAGRVRAPVLVLRAGRDQVVRPARTDVLVASLPEAPTMVSFPHAGHNDISDDPTYWPRVATFLSGEPHDPTQ